MNQLNATHTKFIQFSLAQHVSGINMPIIRSTIQLTTAFDVQHRYCRRESSRDGLLAVCNVWKLLFDSVESVLDIKHGSSLYFTTDDGHIDARNMLS
jgi:hypothetical protein